MKPGRFAPNTKDFLRAKKCLFRGRDLTSLGVSQQAIIYRAKTGFLARQKRGFYYLTGGPVFNEHVMKAINDASRSENWWFSGLSALRYYGLVNYNPDEIHIKTTETDHLRRWFRPKSILSRVVVARARLELETPFVDHGDFRVSDPYAAILEAGEAISVEEVLERATILYPLDGEVLYDKVAYLALIDFIDR